MINPLITLELSGHFDINFSNSELKSLPDKQKRMQNFFLRCMHDVSFEIVKMLPDVSLHPCKMYHKQIRPLYLSDNFSNTVILAELIVVIYGV